MSDGNAYGCLAKNNLENIRFVLISSLSHSVYIL